MSLSTNVCECFFPSICFGVMYVKFKKKKTSNLSQCVICNFLFFFLQNVEFHLSPIIIATRIVKKIIYTVFWIRTFCWHQKLNIFQNKFFTKLWNGSMKDEKNRQCRVIILSFWILKVKLKFQWFFCFVCLTTFQKSCCLSLSIIELWIYHCLLMC